LAKILRMVPWPRCGIVTDLVDLSVTVREATLTLFMRGGCVAADKRVMIWRHLACVFSTDTGLTPDNGCHFACNLSMTRPHLVRGGRPTRPAQGARCMFWTPGETRTVGLGEERPMQRVAWTREPLKTIIR